MIELRDAPDAASATSSTIVEQQAAFLLKNGIVVGLDSSSNLLFDHIAVNSLYVIVRHRNHLPVMSASQLINMDGISTWDFSTDVTQAYQSGEKLMNGKAVMFGGDVNADGTLDQDDDLIWKNEVGSTGYLKSDATLDGQADNRDKNDIWVPNNRIGSPVTQ